MINEQLFHLYASRIQGINALYADLDAKDIKDYAGPLLPYCWEQKYLESKYRLVIFGRETNGWYSDYMNSEEKIWMNVEGHRSSRAREFHPHPLTEPCMKVSPHTALHTQLFVHRHNLGV